MLRRFYASGCWRCRRSSVYRASTGRIYIQNVDHCNTHSPFDPAIAPVRQSNLCLEIALPTK
ncbi:hypothetical protein ACSLNJ_07385, partial [Escherichia coli]